MRRARSRFSCLANRGDSELAGYGPAHSRRSGRSFESSPCRRRWSDRL